MKRFTRPFRQLRGRLTLYYTLTAVVSFLLIEVIAIAVIFWVVKVNGSDILLHNLAQDAPQAASYITQSGPDRKALSAWLQGINDTISHEEPFNFHPIFLAVIDKEGQTIASVGSHPIPAGTLLAQLSQQDGVRLRAVL